MIKSVDQLFTNVKTFLGSFLKMPVTISLYSLAINLSIYVTYGLKMLAYDRFINTFDLKVKRLRFPGFQILLMLD